MDYERLFELLMDSMEDQSEYEKYLEDLNDFGLGDGWR